MPIAPASEPGSPRTWITKAASPGSFKTDEIAPETRIRRSRPGNNRIVGGNRPNQRFNLLQIDHVPSLLVSVRSGAEASTALAGGAAIIDVKEPLHGPLGRAPIAVCAKYEQSSPRAFPSALLSASSTIGPMGTRRSSHATRGRALPSARSDCRTRLPTGSTAGESSFASLRATPSFRRLPGWPWSTSIGTPHGRLIPSRSSTRPARLKNAGLFCSTPGTSRDVLESTLTGNRISIACVVRDDWSRWLARSMSRRSGA